MCSYMHERRPWVCLLGKWHVDDVLSESVNSLHIRTLWTQPSYTGCSIVTLIKKFTIRINICLPILQQETAQCVHTRHPVHEKSLLSFFIIVTKPRTQQPGDTANVISLSLTFQWIKGLPRKNNVPRISSSWYQNAPPHHPHPKSSSFLRSWMHGHCNAKGCKLYYRDMLPASTSVLHSRTWAKYISPGIQEIL